MISDPAFRREIEALYRLGPRVTGELIAELIHRHGPGVRARLAVFANLDVDAAAGSDQQQGRLGQAADDLVRRGEHRVRPERER